MFDFDMRKIEWRKYYESLTMGVKVYLIKDDMKELPKAIQLQRRYGCWVLFIKHCVPFKVTFHFINFRATARKII